MSADTNPIRRPRRIQEVASRGYRVGKALGDAAEPGENELLGAAGGAARHKELGAYYTDPWVARFLVRWAVLTGHDTVLDPSSGDGVFLSAAVERIQELGGSAGSQVYGVEIDELTYRRAALQSGTGEPLPQIVRSDFFDLEEADLPRVDAVVGNPPFIRYQRFTGETRSRAITRAREAGVELSQLTSAWAPFLVHAMRFVKPSGRLAMVAPAELAHASYARPVLEFLTRGFRAVHILTFRRKLFRNLSEDTVLILAAGRGEAPESFRLIDLPDATALPSDGRPFGALPEGVQVDPASLSDGKARLLHYLLPDKCLRLYQELRSLPAVKALGDVANVGIGYVTGDNDFFHLDKLTAEAYELSPDYVRRAARDGSDLVGLDFTSGDWESLHSRGRANLLLYIQGNSELRGSLRAYLRQGTMKGVPQRYKCRVRDPWYVVPHVYEADAFLTYMSGVSPKLVVNRAGAVAPNTLHVVRFHSSSSSVHSLALAASWQTSLSVLSCELEGHSLGGGMLKLEPSEARAVAVAMPSIDEDVLQQTGAELDKLLRSGDMQAARELADTVILRDGMGLSDRDIRELRDGYSLFQTRRVKR